jgi:chromosome segregation ATPase
MPLNLQTNTKIGKVAQSTIMKRDKSTGVGCRTESKTNIKDSITEQPDFSCKCKFIAKPEEEKETLRNLVKDLTADNERLRKEMEEKNQDVRELLDKYKLDIQEYDERILKLIKDKENLQQRVMAADSSVESNDREVKKLISELEYNQEYNEAKVMAVNSEHEFKVAHLETISHSYKIALETKKAQNEEVLIKKNYLEKYMEKIKRLEETYIEQIKNFKLNDNANELLLNINKENEEIMRKLERISEGKGSAPQIRHTLQEALKTAYNTIAKIGANIAMKENKNELNLLQQKNVKTHSSVEQLKAIIEQNRKDNEKLMSMVSNKDSALSLIQNENEQLRAKFQSDVSLLRSECDAKMKVWEVKKKGLNEKLNEAEEEIKRLRAKLLSKECEQFKVSSADEKHNEMKINSLELLIEEYKNFNEKLKEQNKSLDAELTKERSENVESKSRYYDLQNDINQYEERIKNLNDNINETNNQLLKKGDEIMEMQREYMKDQEALTVQLKEASERLAKSEKEKQGLRERISELGEEVEKLKATLKSREERLSELSETLIQQNKLSWEIESQLKETQEELDQARIEVDRLLEENDALKYELAERDSEIETLRVVLASQKQGEGSDGKSSQIIYTADGSSDVDKMFALYINAQRCPVKLKKIGNGQYIFGTKKIFAKIQNGKLVIRVGGGFMMIEDFLTTYTAQELSKMGRNVVTDNEQEPAVYKSLRGKETVIEGELEYDNMATNGSHKKGDHLTFTKSITNSIASRSISSRSRSPGFTNSLGRKPIGEALPVRSSIDRLDYKFISKKFGMDEKTNKENE